MDTNYTRIFVGSQIEALGISNKLKAVGIIAVVKDEEESARLAGFGSSPATSTEVFVHNDELEKAEKALDS